MGKMILETTRLKLYEFNLEDSEFILELLNTPDWIEFIGDKKVKSSEDALDYLHNGPIKSYKENGYGLWKVVSKDSSDPIGMCGLVKRDFLENIDIGFALLPQYYRKGYGYEIATATISYAQYTLNHKTVLAITNPSNIASIKLLTNMGFEFCKTINPSENNSALVFSLSQLDELNSFDQIEQLTHNFLGVFNNKDGKLPNLEKIRDMFIPSGLITNCTEDSTKIYDLDKFISERQIVLSDGTLKQFEENEISGTTKLFGNMAQRFCLYRKSGILSGQRFTNIGCKTIQFIRKNQNWYIASIIWYDEENSK